MNPALEALLPDDVRNVSPIRFESATAAEVWKAAIRTKEGSDLYGKDPDEWQKILTSTSYGKSARNVC